MVNKGKRIGDAKKKKQVKSITFFHNPNDSQGMPDPVQQFDILSGIEKEEKVKEKDIFDGVKSTKPVKKKEKTHDKRREIKMKENQVRGQKRGLDKKKPPKPGERTKK